MWIAADVFHETSRILWEKKQIKTDFCQDVQPVRGVSADPDQVGFVPEANRSSSSVVTSSH